MFGSSLDDVRTCSENLCTMVAHAVSSPSARCCCTPTEGRNMRACTPWTRRRTWRAAWRPRCACGVAGAHTLGPARGWRRPPRPPRWRRSRRSRCRCPCCRCRPPRPAAARLRARLGPRHWRGQHSKCLAATPGGSATAARPGAAPRAAPGGPGPPGCPRSRQGRRAPPGPPGLRPPQARRAPHPRRCQPHAGLLPRRRQTLPGPAPRTATGSRGAARATRRARAPATVLLSAAAWPAASRP